MALFLGVQSTQVWGIQDFYTRNRSSGLGNILCIWVLGPLGCGQGTYYGARKGTALEGSCTIYTINAEEFRAQGLYLFDLDLLRVLGQWSCNMTVSTIGFQNWRILLVHHNRHQDTCSTEERMGPCYGRMQAADNIQLPTKGRHTLFLACALGLWATADRELV